jgi:hypothetical protein
MTPEFMEFIRHAIESHDRQLGELTDRVAATEKHVESAVDAVRDLAGHMATLADHMAALAQTSINHERRLNDLEGDLEGGAR